MRDRHFPRLCASCAAPLARQEDACWRCDTPWAADEQPRTALRVIAGGARTQTPPDAERWLDEGGTVAAD